MALVSCGHAPAPLDGLLDKRILSGLIGFGKACASRDSGAFASVLEQLAGVTVPAPSSLPTGTFSTRRRQYTEEKESIL